MGIAEMKTNLFMVMLASYSQLSVIAILRAAPTDVLGSTE